MSAADLQGGAVLREGGAEEGVDGVKHHVDDVLLQDGIAESLLSLVTNLQTGKTRESSCMCPTCWGRCSS